MYVLKWGRPPLCPYPLPDAQRDFPVDWCAGCGGEIYRFDPVEWNEAAPVCPACAARKKREREILEET